MTIVLPAFSSGRTLGIAVSLLVVATGSELVNGFDSSNWGRPSVLELEKSKASAVRLLWVGLSPDMIDLLVNELIVK